MGFDETAKDYDSWYQTPFGRYADKLERNLILSFIGSVDGIRLLDLGCGTGNYVIKLAERGAHVTGLDLSKEMLRVAAKKVRRGKLNTAFVLGSAESLPFKRRLFDAVISVTSFCYFNDPNKVVGEMERVSKSGGEIVVGVLNKWSIYGIQKKLKSKIMRSIYKGTRFHSISDLKNLFGKIEWDSTLFAPPWIPGRLLSRFNRLENALPLLFRPFGAFITIKRRIKGEKREIQKPSKGTRQRHKDGTRSGTRRGPPYPPPRTPGRNHNQYHNATVMFLHRELSLRSPVGIRGRKHLIHI